MNFVYRTITVFGSTFQWIQLFISDYPRVPWGSTCPSRNPLISMTHVRHPVRGNTCVLLGAEFEYESLDCSHFARHY